MAPDGSEVVTTDGVDRRWRFCRCRECGVVEQCTPSNDFWTTETAGSGEGLLCDRCFNTHLHARYTVVDARKN